jgi:hypothetical protein
MKGRLGRLGISIGGFSIRRQSGQAKGYRDNTAMQRMAEVRTSIIGAQPVIQTK